MPAPSWRAVVTALVSRPSRPWSSESAAGNSAGLAKPMPKPEIVKPIAIASPLETGIAMASVPAATIAVPTVTMRRSDQSRCVTRPVPIVQVRLETSSGNEAQKTDQPGAGLQRERDHGRAARERDAGRERDQAGRVARAVARDRAAGRCAVSCQRNASASGIEISGPGRRQQQPEREAAEQARPEDVGARVLVRRERPAPEAAQREDHASARAAAG